MGHAMRRVGAVGILLWGAGLSVAAPAAAADARFQFGGVEFEAPVPSGYCLPEGKSVKAARILAEGDKGSRTHLTLWACSRNEPSTYILLKTPVPALDVTATREEVIASMGSAFDNPEMAAALASGKFNADAEKSVTEALRTRVGLSGEIRPLGKDEMCAYLGGIIAVVIGEQSYKISVGICVTAISDRVLTVNWYGPEGGAAGVARLLVKAKGFARSIRSRPAR
jgi:hypothetical protein